MGAERRRHTLRPIAVTLVLLCAVAGLAHAQTFHREAPRVASVPFGPGEKAVYQVELGLFGDVGTGVMEVVGVEDVHGAPTYHLRFDLEGGILFAKVDDRLQSWLDVAELFSRRFEQEQDELTYERHRIYDFFPEKGIWKRENDETGPLPTKRPLDDVSFVYFVRTLPLEVGKTYTFDRYFKEDGNPVVVKVLRRDTVTVPAGTFNTIVVQPIIQTDGLFGEGGEAEIHFTDDAQRILVMMKSNVPVLGSLNLYLRSYTPGRKLSPVMLQSPGFGRLDQPRHLVGSGVDGPSNDLVGEEPEARARNLAESTSDGLGGTDSVGDRPERLSDDLAGETPPRPGGDRAGGKPDVLGRPVAGVKPEAPAADSVRTGPGGPPGDVPGEKLDGRPQRPGR